MGGEATAENVRSINTFFSFLPFSFFFTPSLSCFSLEKNSLFASHQKITVKYKIDGALNQNTNSNHNFKINQIRTKKKKNKADPSEPRWGEEDLRWWEEKKGCPLAFVIRRRCEREKERELEKKRKKKSEDSSRRNARSLLA